jgi:hypothetical protein
MFAFEDRGRRHFLEENATQQSWIRGMAILELL